MNNRRQQPQQDRTFAKQQQQQHGAQSHLNSNQDQDTYVQTLPRNQSANANTSVRTNPNFQQQQHPAQLSQQSQQSPYHLNHQVASVGQSNEVLQARIYELENQSVRQSQANESLLNKLQSTEAELRRTKESLNRLGDTAAWKGGQVSDLNARYHELSQGHNLFLDNVRTHSFTVQKELEAKDEEIRRLRELLDSRTDNLKVVAVTQERNFDRCLALDKEITTLQEANSKLRAELQQKSHELDMSKLSHKAEGTFMVEVEHLRADVARLLSMLKNTQEYQEFAEISDDSSQSIRFLKDIRARTYVDAKCHSKCRLLRPCMCPPKSGENQWIEDEKLLWVPEESFKFAHEFRLKYQGELTDTLIENLLFELNKIWSKREQRLLARLKGNAASETAGLRRQLAFNPKYDEHQAKATIARLENQLKQVYKENREAFAQRERRNPPGTKYVNETMKLNKELQKSKKRNEEKNAVLKQHITALETGKYGDASEKTIFMEGAQWASKKVLQEVSSLHQGINDHAKSFYEKSEQLFALSESGSFSTTITASQIDPHLIRRKCDWFLENVDSEVLSFKNKIESIHRNSEKDMIEAAQDAKQILRPTSAIISSF